MSAALNHQPPVPQALEEFFNFENGVYRSLCGMGESEKITGSWNGRANLPAILVSEATSLQTGHTAEKAPSQVLLRTHITQIDDTTYLDPYIDHGNSGDNTEGLELYACQKTFRAVRPSEYEKAVHAIHASMRRAYLLKLFLNFPDPDQNLLLNRTARVTSTVLYTRPPAGYSIRKDGTYVRKPQAVTRYILGKPQIKELHS